MRSKITHCEKLKVCWLVYFSFFLRLKKKKHIPNLTFKAFLAQGCYELMSAHCQLANLLMLHSCFITAAILILIRCPITFQNVIKGTLVKLSRNKMRNKMCVITGSDRDERQRLGWAGTCRMLLTNRSDAVGSSKHVFFQTSICLASTLTSIHCCGFSSPLQSQLLTQIPTPSTC